MRIGLQPVGLLEGVVSAMKAGLAALKEDGKRAGALSSAKLQKILGYRDYERDAARFA
jgi:hypothetical protein